MARLRQGDMVSVYDKRGKKWRRAHIDKALCPRSVSVCVEGDTFLTVSRGDVYKYKQRVKRKSTCSEKYFSTYAHKRRGVRLIPVQFKSINTFGDYKYMSVKSDVKMDALFIFNDNLTQYLSDDTFEGGGNAIVRPLRQHGYAFGIPTGDFGGAFQKIEDVVRVDQENLTVKDIIDSAMLKMLKMIKNTPRIDRVYYCVDNSGVLGCGIFNVGMSVRLYITDWIKNINVILRHM